MSDQDLDAKKKKKEASLKEKLSPLKFTYPDIQMLTNQVIAILKKTVISNVIDALKNDPELSEWVKTGLVKHKKDNSSECLFCGETLSANRLRELEAHFNEKYNAFITEIENISEAVQSAINCLKLGNLPNRLSLYDHLHVNYEIKSQELEQDMNKIKTYLQDLRDILDKKSRVPFQAIEREFRLLSEILKSSLHSTR